MISKVMENIGKVPLDHVLSNMVEAVLGLWITAIGTESIVFIDSGDVDSHYSLFRCSKMLQKTQSTQQNQPKSFSRQSQSNQECF